MYNNVSETVQSLKDYLGDIRNENISESADAQRKFCSSNTFIDGLGVTILNHSYLHSLILGEVKRVTSFSFTRSMETRESEH